MYLAMAILVWIFFHHAVAVRIFGPHNDRSTRVSVITKTHTRTHTFMNIEAELVSMRGECDVNVNLFHGVNCCLQENARAKKDSRLSLSHTHMHSLSLWVNWCLGMRRLRAVTVVSLCLAHQQPALSTQTVHKEFVCQIRECS